MLGRRLRAAGVVVLVAAGGPAIAAEKSTAHSFSGVAAYYDTNYHGRTAAGETYDPHKFTAAHRTLPFGTRLKVTDRRTGRSVEVTVNDRGPFTRGRVLDLSLAAAKQLRMLGRGLLRVTADVEPTTSTR
jgi:rare lipoprotein A